MRTIDRRVGESIQIGDDVTVTVLRVLQRYGHPQVRIGIAAPRAIPVHREEVAEKIKRDREIAHYLNNGDTSAFDKPQAD